MTGTRTYDTTPKPRLLHGMQHDTWTVHGAISELVDNAFGRGRGNAKNVIVTCDHDQKVIEVLDDGRGMKAVGDLFRLGETIGRHPDDIGVFGSGGTYAILWLSTAVNVWTLRQGKVQHVAVHWPTAFKQEHFPQVSNEWEPANLSNTPPELLAINHGTLIRCRLLKERRIYASVIQRNLAETYAPAARLGRQLVWRTIHRGETTESRIGEWIEPIEPTNEIAFEIEFPAPGDDDTGTLRASGKVGIYPDLPQREARIAISYGPRVIFYTRDPYSSQESEERFTGNGVKGYVDLKDGWQEYLALTKDGINDARASERLFEEVFKRIKPLLQEVEHHVMTLIFDNIALNLESALNAMPQSGKTVVKAKEQDDGDLKMRGRGEGGDGPGPGPGPDTDKRGVEDEEGDRKGSKDQPQQTNIIVIRQSEEAMEGLLCTAAADKSGIIVSVNQDHHVVRQAMVSKPVNKMLLEHMAANQIALILVKDDKLLSRAFGPAILETLAKHEEDLGWKQGFVTRQLIDKTRRTPSSEEEAA